MVHMGFDDPPALCSSDMEEEECLEQYRRVRDQIREFVQHLPEVLEGAGEKP
jgi:arsenate reductase